MSAVRWWWSFGGLAHVHLPSPLQLSVAADRLAGELRSRPRSPATGVVVGRVSADRVRLSIRRRSTRNSWQPVLRGRLVPAPQGCRLVGEVGVHPFVRWFTRCWLLLVLAFATAGVVGVGAALLAGEGHDALDVLPLALVGLGMAAFGVALSTLATRYSRADGPPLVAWAAEQLESPARPPA